MSNYKGSHLGGVRTLQDLRGRCVMSKATGCWHLRAADGKVLRPKAKSAPRICTLVDGEHKGVSARRWSWMQLHRREPGAGFVITYKCQHWDCVNPAHMVCMQRSEHTAMMVERGAYRTVQKAGAIRQSARARKNVKLSEELAQWIRESNQTQVEIAHAMNICQQRVSDVLRGKIWRTAAPRSSVWALAA